MTSHSEEDDKLIRGNKYIYCPNCGDKSTRVGAQDYCDIYVCELKHITRIKIGAARKEWNELVTGNSEPAQGT